MAKKIKKAAKKVVKKVLDKTELDEKVMEHIDENRSLYNKILCYCKCYGGYVLAVGAGCTFGTNNLVGLGLLVVAGIWAYNVRRCKIGGCSTTKKSCC